MHVVANGGDAAVGPPVTATGPVDWDFARSFLRFTSDRVNHTPRLQLDALCRVTEPGRPGRELVLTAPWLGERMYVASGLIHQPTFEFVMVEEARVAFAVLRHHANAADDLAEAHRVGEAMSTRSGVPARVTAVDVTLRRFDAVERIEDYEGFRRALLADRPMVGRTSYRSDDGALVEVEYPVKTGNVAHGAPAWRVDAGFVPWLDPSADGELLVSRVGLGYLVYGDVGRRWRAAWRCPWTREDRPRCTTARSSASSCGTSCSRRSDAQLTRSARPAVRAPRPRSRWARP